MWHKFRDVVGHRLHLSFCRNNRHGEEGFSLVELIIVVAIMAVLAAIAVPSYNKLINRAKVTSATSTIKTIEWAVTAYFIDTGVYPNAIGDINFQNTLDPFGNNYVYVNVANVPASARTIAGTPINIDFDIYSKGADGDSALSLLDPSSSDDIIRASEGSYMGLVSAF
ncbi:MAG: prepilin-type cleavage/methylation domain-containing protein [Desulfuromonas sp.]|nr:MAG: prepilin-type cleavage/methylation domain-containing protein [Desulfuromonas sp.]